MGESIKCYITYAFRAFILSIIIAVIGILIVAGMLYKGMLTNDTLDTAIYVLYFMSSFGGGLIVGRKMGKRKFIWGFLYGITLFIAILLVAYAGQGDLNAKNRLISGVICAIGGMFGGMIGG